MNPVSDPIASGHSPGSGVPAALFVATCVLLFLVGALLLIGAMPERHRHVDADYFQKRLERIAGPGATACGHLMIDRRLGGGLGDCLPAAVASGKPFHVAMVFDGFGHGMKDWIGYARDAQGRVWVVSYDNDVTGGWGDRPVPSISQARCPGFRLEAYVRRLPLFCDFGTR